MRDQNGQWYQRLLTLFAIFYKSNAEGTNFRIMFVCCFLFFSFKVAQTVYDKLRDMKGELG